MHEEGILRVPHLKGHRVESRTCGSDSSCARWKHVCSAWRERQGVLLTSGWCAWRQVWNLLGLCRTSMGDIGGGVAAYQRAIALAPDFREAWLNLAQARKEARAPCGSCAPSCMCTFTLPSLRLMGPRHLLPVCLPCLERTQKDETQRALRW